MSNLVGLPGVRAKAMRNVPIATSVSGAMRALRSSRAVMGAGIHGGWTVWTDDAGALRCDFSRNCVTVNRTTLTRKTEVRAWLHKWLPRTSRPAK